MALSPLSNPRVAERPLSPIVYKCAVDFPKKLAQDALTQLHFEEGKNRGQDRE